MDAAPVQSTIQTFWAQVLARGLFPLPIAFGTKAPMGEWRHVREPYPEPPAGTASIGLRCTEADTIAAVDVDCEHPGTLEQFRAVMGDSIPIRWGRKPRFLIPFIRVGPIEARDFKMSCGCKLQIISGGKQFVAFGPHANGKDVYEWANYEQEWPRVNRLQLFTALAQLHVDVTRAFGDAPEDASDSYLKDAKPRNESETQAARDYVASRIAELITKLTGMREGEGRGGIVYETVAQLRPAVDWSLLSRERIQEAIWNAGQALSSGEGRTMDEEISRGLGSPVRTDNPVLRVVLQHREIMRGVFKPGRTLADVMAKERTPLKFAVDKILPQGLIIAAAPPKFGKSFIALDLVTEVAKGGTFWGEKCTQGDVLLFDFEGDEDISQERVDIIHPAGSAGLNGVHLYYAEDVPSRISLQPGVPGFVEFLEGELKKFPQTRLVVIDTLINIRPDPRNKTQQLYQMDYESVSVLQRLIKKYRVSCVCMHHTRKSTEGAMIMDRVSGSYGLTGAADGAWTIGEQDGMAHLTTNMRRVKSFDCALVKDEDSPLWRPKNGAAAMLPGHKTAILAAVTAVASECTAHDIAVRTGLPVETVRVYLHRMKGKELEPNLKPGIFRLANTAPKSRPEGARDILVNAANGGAWDEYQAGKVVDAKHVLHVFKNTPPTDKGYAVSPDAARDLLSAFHEPDKLLRDLEGRKLAYIFDKVLLIPYETPVIQVAAAPARPMPWVAQGILLRTQEEQRALKKLKDQGKMPWDL